MSRTFPTPPRRAFLTGVSAAAVLTVPAIAAAERLARTPRQPLGPFYPDEMPLDRDNDLVRVKGHDAHAVGEVTHVFGQVRGMDGRPVQGARVEIWQCDSRGRYIHTADAGRGRSDPHFQGYGRIVTDADGRYRFRTIKPVPYPGRTPHIHFAVEARNFDRLVTQMYVAGDPRNARDGLLQSVRDPAARQALIVPLAPAGRVEADALAGTFDIVLGKTA